MKEEQEKNSKKTQNRRDFIKTVMAAAAFMIVPRHVLGRGFVL
jgi:hypothetical protein